MRIAMTQEKVGLLARYVDGMGQHVLAAQLRRMPSKMSGGWILNDLLGKLRETKNHLERHEVEANTRVITLIDEFILWAEHGFTNSEDMIREARDWYRRVPLAWDRGQALLNIIDRELGPKAAK